MTALQFHPLADIFPLVEGSEDNLKFWREAVRMRLQAACWITPFVEANGSARSSGAGIISEFESSQNGVCGHDPRE